MQNVQQLALSDLVLPETAPGPDLALEARRGCVIYVRVSTIAQEDGFSPEIQRQQGLTLAAREAFVVVEVIEETASGQDVERPGLQRVTQLIEMGRVGHVIAYALDRISRETWQGLQLAWRCQKYGVRLWDAKSGRERYHTDDDRLLVEVESILAGFELRKIVARMRAGKRQRSLQGHPTPRCPYGYRYVRDMARRKADKGHWEVCEDEAVNVREIFARYLAGGSLTQIAANLTARQVMRRPYPGAPRTKAPDHLWRPSFISAILNCRTYTGELTECRARRVPTVPGATFKTTQVPRPVEEQVVLAVPAIISEEIWAAVARLRAVNGKRRRKLAAPDVLLSGHLWCGTCGATMGRDTAVEKRGRHRGTLYVYYRCHGRRVFGRTHAQTTRNARRLDDAVWQVLTHLLAAPRLLQKALGLGQTADPRTADARARDAERARLRAALATCEAAQAYLVELASAQQAEIAAVTRKFQTLRAQETQIRADLARLETVGPEVATTPRPTAADLAAVCAQAASVLASDDLIERRTLLKALALTVLWHPEDRSIELWGTLPLPTPTPFAWDGATVHVPPGRRFVPGMPLLPPRAPDQPALLVWPVPPETLPARPRRRRPGPAARHTPPRPAAGLGGARP
jgi:DNA invertase Pin-like site-specific DNA recombinase